MTKAERIIYILTLLRSHRYLKARDLAVRCGVSERTIYRDLISISGSNIPIYFNHGYRLLDLTLLPPVSFTSAESDYLLMLLRSQGRFGDDGTCSLPQRIIEKIKASGAPRLSRVGSRTAALYEKRCQVQAV